MATNHKTRQYRTWVNTQAGDIQTVFVDAKTMSEVRKHMESWYGRKAWNTSHVIVWHKQG